MHMIRKSQLRERSRFASGAAVQCIRTVSPVILVRPFCPYEKFSTQTFIDVSHRSRMQ
jgi:hypothetical protein